MLYPIDKAKEILQFYRDFVSTAPEELTTGVAFLTVPPFPFLTDPADTEKNIRWARQLWESIQPFSAPAAYVNYIGDEGEDLVKEAAPFMFAPLT